MLVYLIYSLRVFSESLGNLSSYIGAAIITVWLALLLVGKTKIQFSSDAAFIKLFWVYFFVSCFGIIVGWVYFHHVLFLQAIYFTLKILSIPAMYYLLKSGVFLDRNKTGKLLIWLIFVHIVISAYNVWLVATGGTERATWPYAHPNVLGVTLAILSAYCIFKQTKITAGNALLAAMLVAGLFSTKSISSVLLLSFILAVGYITSYRSLVSIFFGTVLVVVFINMGDFFLADRFKALVFDVDRYLYLITSPGHIEFENSLEWRFWYWAHLLKIAATKPFLGFGTISWMLISPVKYEIPSILNGYNPHSEFVGWMVQFGFLGTAVLLLFWVKVGIHYLRELARRPGIRAFACPLLAMLTIGLIGKEVVYYIQAYYLLILIYVNAEERLRTELEPIPQNVSA